jgi:hypothetical protein
MIIGEPLLERVFDEDPVRWLAYGAAIVAVLAAGEWRRRDAMLRP